MSVKTPSLLTIENHCSYIVKSLRLQGQRTTANNIKTGSFRSFFFLFNKRSSKVFLLCLLTMQVKTKS